MKSYVKYFIINQFDTTIKSADFYTRTAFNQHTGAKESLFNVTDEALHSQLCSFVSSVNRCTARALLFQRSGQ